MEVKWYSFFELLVGVILSFADPITDILTVVEFYRADHKTWFGVGLAFVILPCLFFPVLYFLVGSDYKLASYTGTRKCAQTFLCGCHPFSSALMKLQGFLFYLKKKKRVDEVDSDGNEDAEDNTQLHILVHVFFESVLESAPQFVIQLYAMNVQEEPVTVIQIISLPISFLSLTWAFTTVDVELHRRAG